MATMQTAANTQIGIVIKFVSMTENPKPFTSTGRKLPNAARLNSVVQYTAAVRAVSVTFLDLLAVRAAGEKG